MLHLGQYPNLSSHFLLINFTNLVCLPPHIHYAFFHERMITGWKEKSCVRRWNMLDLCFSTRSLANSHWKNLLALCLPEVYSSLWGIWLHNSGYSTELTSCPRFIKHFLDWSMCFSTHFARFRDLVWMLQLPLKEHLERGCAKAMSIVASRYGWFWLQCSMLT